MMSDLPKERLGLGKRPFTYTGLDYFGPFYVVNRRLSCKRWGFLFTCLTTRALHIEIVQSMDTDSCIMGLERFVSRRGLPSVIWSDNGTNFVGTDRELVHCLKSWDQNKIWERMVQQGVKWKFIPPASPHQGGAWERLVQSVKRAFIRVLGTRKLTDEVLQTTFCIVEQMLNARPLTAVSDSPNELQALTPNHFLLGEASHSLPYEVDEPEKSFDHRKCYRRARAYADHIWARWLKEYVPALNPRAKWRQPSHDLRCGDLVWLAETGTPRGCYPLARVVSLHYGKDGVARSADLKTTYGTRTRPVTKLVPVFNPSSSGAEDVADAMTSYT